jgi:hypothetical protein
MVNWYNNSKKIITKSSLISVFFLIIALVFYIIQRVNNSEVAKTIGLFSLTVAMGQFIGEQIGFRRKKSIPLITILALIAYIVFYSNPLIKNIEILFFVFGFLGGITMGFNIGRSETNKKKN